MSSRPVVFGEVLFDVFADRQTLGGAPFNVAWHLQGFGLSPLFISRVGEDDLGRRVRDAMEEWGMARAGLEWDPIHPTGRVQVTLDKGEPEYRIVPDQAYDFIAGDVIATDAYPSDALLYHGSLAVRNAESRQPLERLLALNHPRFVDVNLREPWWSSQRVRDLIQGANIVKVNADELLALGGSSGSPVESAAQLQQDLSVATLIVTLGKEGAFVRTENAEVFQAPAPRPEPFVDAVGAGDAFSSIVILGLLSEWDWPKILQRATWFAAKACQWRGAFQNDPRIYSQARASELKQDGGGYTR